MTEPDTSPGLSGERPAEPQASEAAPSTPIDAGTLERISAVSTGAPTGEDAAEALGFFRPRAEALRVAGWFLAVSVVWIILSDRVVVALFPSPTDHHAVQTAKGIGFVVVTAALIAVLVYRLVRRLERKRALLSTALGTLAGVVHVVDDLVFTTDADGRLTGLYGRGLAQLGLSGPAQCGKPVGHVLPIQGPLLDDLRRSLRPGESNVFEVPWLQGEMRRIVMLRMAPLSDHGGQVLGLVGSCRDVTEQREAAQEHLRQRERIALMAETDALTRLPNRRGLQREVGLRGVRAPDVPRILVLLDIDHFKVINSSLGHLGGDDALRTLARILDESSPRGALVARVGSDEFVVVLENSDLEQARSWVLALQQKMRDMPDLPSGELVFSAGIAPLAAGDALGPALSLAESALFASREQGPGRCVAFAGPDAAQQVLRGAEEWGPRIRHALREHGFELHLQPVVSLQGPATEAVAFEVLLRLLDDEGQPLAPGAFMPTAERFGWMPRIDAWVVAEAVSLLRTHTELCLFVNLSAHGLSSPELRDAVDRLLDRSPEVTSRLILEVTESGALSEDALTLAWMDDVRERGCRFALDDFGKGFSTFDYLRRIPADFVKLDGQFVQGMVHDPDEQAIVQAMVRVCHCLGKQVVAEMVESSEAEHLLRSMGVDLAQGWRWDRARPAAEAIARHPVSPIWCAKNPGPRLAPDRDGRHHDGPTTSA